MMASTRRDQRGVTLAVSLILLVLATLLGLAGVRGSSLQERMSANMYDRSLAFQQAESALRAAEAEITLDEASTALIGADCSTAAGVICAVVPDDTFSGTSSHWIRVDDAHDVNDPKTPGTPEYFIQFMGTGRAASNLGLEANADHAAYGNDGSQSGTVAFYRITARSSAPADATDRSIVVLQATFKRAL